MEGFITDGIVSERIASDRQKIYTRRDQIRSLICTLGYLITCILRFVHNQSEHLLNIKTTMQKRDFKAGKMEMKRLNAKDFLKPPFQELL